MTLEQSNYLNMTNAVVSLFDGNNTAWNSVAPLVNGVGKLRKTRDEINITAVKQANNNPTGHTAAKERSRDILESVTLRTALRIRSYAATTDNEVLRKKMQVSRSTLDSMNINELLTFSRVTADACEENLHVLADYGIDQPLVTDLRNAINHTSTLYAHRDVIIDQRTEATAHLQELFTQARKQLKILDDLVEGYVEDDTFVAEYFNARRIHDIRGRKSVNVQGNVE
jgi:uncharacterized coiled-coil DUF342 family protein